MYGESRECKIVYSFSREEIEAAVDLTANRWPLDLLIARLTAPKAPAPISPPRTQFHSILKSPSTTQFMTVFTYGYIYISHMGIYVEIDRWGNSYGFCGDFKDTP